MGKGSTTSGTAVKKKGHKEREVSGDRRQVIAMKYSSNDKTCLSMSQSTHKLRDVTPS